MDVVESVIPTVDANPAGFLAILQKFFAGIFGPHTPSRTQSEISEIDSVDNEIESADRFVLTPCGYAIRVPQPSDFENSVTAMMPSVRQGLNQLPPLPSVALELLREIQNPSSTAGSVAAIASSDPALAAALIRTVNGAAMGLARKITSTVDAVNYLGFATVKAMVVKLRLETVLSPKSPADAADAEDLWIHSLAVSYVAEELARRVSDVDAGFVATLGLLHDIGKLAILAQMPGEAEKLRAIAPANDSSTSRTREAALLGVDHAGLGANVALNWGLPADMVQAIRWHHRPANAFQPGDPLPLRKAVLLVQIANQISKYCFPYTDRLEIDVVPDEAFATLGFEPSLQKLIDAPVQGAITKAIAFGDGNSRRPSTAPRRFLRPLRNEDAIRITAQPANGATQITTDDAAIAELFSPNVAEFGYSIDDSGRTAQPDSGAAAARFTMAATTESLTSALVALRACLAKIDVPTETKTAATLTLGALLPNILALSNADEMIEVAYSVSGRRVILGLRAPCLATSHRLGTPATPETGCRIAQADFTSLLNLCWFERIVITSEGSAVGFWSR